MDGRLITEMRTAAVSAAVTKYLAAPDAHVLALIGSGVQANAHLEALSQVRDFHEIRVWSRTAAHAECFAEQHNAKAMAIADAVRGADVVVTATNALWPIVQGDWLEPGAHVNAVGSPRPNWRELDDRAMANTLVVDSREAVLKESGDVILSGAEIYAEAGEIFAGAKAAPSPGRRCSSRSGSQSKTSRRRNSSTTRPPHWSRPEVVYHCIPEGRLPSIRHASPYEKNR
jgi:thiomorpholine-carboxylate dehydrogenase